MMSGDSYWYTPIQVCRWLSNTIYHQALAVIVIYAIWIPAQNYSNPFSWHVILSTLGLLPLMAEALIIFGAENVWTQDMDRKKKYLLHGFLMTLSAALIITGIALEIDREAQYSDITHFATAHGITGLICMIFLVFSLILGVMAYFAKSLSGYVRPVIIKIVHNSVGQLTFIIGIVSLCLGYYTNWFKYYTSEESRIAATVVTVILCLWSIYYAFREEVRQGRSIRDVPTYRGVPVYTMGTRPGYSRPVSVVERVPSK